MAPLARTVKPLDRVCPTQWPASQISPHATQPRPDIGPPHGEKARFAPTPRWREPDSNLRFRSFAPRRSEYDRWRSGRRDLASVLSRLRARSPTQSHDVYGMGDRPLSASSPQRSYFLDEPPAAQKFPADLGTVLGTVSFTPGSARWFNRFLGARSTLLGSARASVGILI